MSEIKIASYNIHRCYGTDGKYDPERIRRVLHQMDADIIVLQEVESRLHMLSDANISPVQVSPYAVSESISYHGELLDFLTDGSSWQYIEGPTLLREAGRYGNAILSSLPIKQHKLLDLSFKNREPRGAIDLRLEYEHYQLRVIGTHLGLTPAERRYQTKKLLDWIGRPEKGKEEVTFLLGDLNEWYLWGKPLRWLRSWFGAAPSRASYPTCCPFFALDRIWVSPLSYIKQVKIMRNSLTQLASDHYPIIATLDM